jgi:hypothetical protein
VEEFKPAAVKPTISIRDVEKLDVRVGTILAVTGVPKSEKLLKLTVDFGDQRTILAGMKQEWAARRSSWSTSSLSAWRASSRRACCSTSDSRTGSRLSWLCPSEQCPTEFGLANVGGSPSRRTRG